MSSDRRVEANRQNALQSTGPRTPEGKAHVSVNAIKHGLTGRQLVLPGEDRVEFDAFRSDFMADLAPQGALERFLTEKIVLDAWRLRRIWQLEAAIYHREDRKDKLWTATKEKESFEEDPYYNPVRIAPAVKPGMHKAHREAEEKLARLRAEPVAPLTVLTELAERRSTEFANLDRYETTLFRSLLKAHHELERLQAKRVGEPVPAPVAVDVDVNIGQDGTANEGPPLQNKSSSAESVSAKVQPNAPPSLDNSARVSFFITRSQKAQLRDLGFSDDQIAKMSPGEAHQILGIIR